MNRISLILIGIVLAIGYWMFAAVWLALETMGDCLAETEAAVAQCQAAKDQAWWGTFDWDLGVFILLALLWSVLFLKSRRG